MSRRMIIDGMDLDRVTHWLPYGAGERDRTACGLNVAEHSVQWRSNQNEASCKRCLAANVREPEHDETCCMSGVPRGAGPHPDCPGPAPRAKAVSR